MVTVRKATLDDLDWICGECKEFDKFQDSDTSFFNSGHTPQLVETAIKNHVVFVSELNETRTGVVIGFVVNNAFNPEIKVLSEAIWWVSEKYRNGRSGALLLKTFTDWGVDNVDQVMFSLLANSPVSDKYLLKKGYRKKETTYLMEV